MKRLSAITSKISLTLMLSTNYVFLTLIIHTHFDFYVVYFSSYIFFLSFSKKIMYTVKLSCHITVLHNEAFTHNAESYYNFNSSPFQLFTFYVFTLAYISYTFLRASSGFSYPNSSGVLTPNSSRVGRIS